MRRQVEWVCDQHSDPFDCPDCLIYYLPRHREYWLIEPSHVDPGLQGMIAGMVMYGMGLCIPMALVGGIIGGIVGAKPGHSLRPRPDKGGHMLNPDAPEQGAPANRPRE